MKDRLYIIIPAYNEEYNINNLVEEWYPIIEKEELDSQSRLVIINDGSKDLTQNLLEECKKHRSRMVVLTKENSGHGPTLLFGYRYAIKKQADYVFQTDSDRQTDPKEFEQFWLQRNKYDAVIGCRPNRQDGCLRKLIEMMLVLLLFIIFQVRVPDANAPFRLMRTSLLVKYIDRLPDNFFLPNVMLTTYFAFYHEKIHFIPITFKPRMQGVNSIGLKKIIRIGVKAVKDFIFLRKQM